MRNWYSSLYKFNKCHKSNLKKENKILIENKSIQIKKIVQRGIIKMSVTQRKENNTVFTLSIC